MSSQTGRGARACSEDSRNFGLHLQELRRGAIFERELGILNPLSPLFTDFASQRRGSPQSRYPRDSKGGEYLGVIEIHVPRISSRMIDLSVNSG